LILALAPSGNITCISRTRTSSITYVEYRNEEEIGQARQQILKYEELGWNEKVSIIQPI